PPPPGAPEELLALTNENARYTFTSYGGGLKLVELLNYPESVSCGRKRAGAATQRVATLNAQAQHPVLALLGSEALVGDGVFQLRKISLPPPGSTGTPQDRAGEGVLAEKQLTSGLHLVKQFTLSSNYLVNVRVRLENRSGQPLLLP